MYVECTKIRTTTYMYRKSKLPGIQIVSVDSIDCTQVMCHVGFCWCCTGSSCTCRAGLDQGGPQAARACGRQRRGQVRVLCRTVLGLVGLRTDVQGGAGAFSCCERACSLVVWPELRSPDVCRLVGSTAGRLRHD